MPFLAYYGCSKLLKARAVFYWGTHTRFTVSVGIELSLTKIRRTRSAECMCMDKRARIVLYGKWWIRTWQYVKRNILPRFYGISHACANSGAQAVFPLPRKKRPGNETSKKLALASYNSKYNALHIIRTRGRPVWSAVCVKTTFSRRRPFS